MVSAAEMPAAASVALRGTADTIAGGRVRFRGITTRTLTTDYLVVGAGAMGMAFADAVVDHADVVGS